MSFACAVHYASPRCSECRGFHVYHTVWTPSIGEELATTRERRNPHDRFSVAVVQQLAARRLLYATVSTLNVMSLGEGRALARELR